MLKHIVQRPFLMHVLQILGLATAYFIAGILGDMLVIPPSYATVIFPSSGIALAAILFYGNRMAWGVLLGAFLLVGIMSIMASNLSESLHSIHITLAIACGATLQALVGAYLVRRWAGKPEILSNEKNILLFFLYGGFVSALVNSTLSVSLLVATERIPAEAFFVNWLSWWGGDALGIIIFAPLVLVGLSQENPVWQNKKWSITLPIVAMFLLTIMAVFYEIKTSNARIKIEFDQHANALSTLIESSINNDLNALRSLNNFYEAAHYIEADEFKTFVSHLLKNFPPILNMGFSPIIKASEREKFENNLKREGVSNFQITEQNPELNNQLVPAGNRPEYMPIRYIEPLQLNKNIHNFDIYSTASRREAIDKARDTGELSITKKVTLVYEMGKYTGIVAYLPVYQNDLPHETVAERRAAILGYNFIAFRTVEMMAFALKNQNLADLVYRLIDENAAVDEQILFTSDAQEPPFKTAQEIELLKESQSFIGRTTFDIGGRVWRLEITPTPEYFIWHRSTNVWLILLAGFSLTLIVSITVLMSSISQYQVRQLNGKRLEEKQKLEFQAMKLAILDSQNTEKEKRANELLIANEKFLSANQELIAANEQLVFQNEEKIKRVEELALSYEQNMLLNFQLNHIQKLESIGRMTSGIAHDFNNILSCILGYNEMNQYVSDDLNNEILKAELENNTKQIDLAGKRAADLINKMLAYCRQDTPKTNIKVQPTQIVIAEVLAMLRPALTSRIKFETVFESDHIIQIDAIDLHQILTNLAINARDAMKERGGIITISLKNVMNMKAHCVACAAVMEGDFIELSMADNGTGIESKIISRLFDPFFTTKPQGEGTGLGLSAVSGMR